MIVKYLDREIETQDAKKVKQLIKNLNIIPSTVLVLKNGEIVDESDRINPLEDKIEIVRVISGG